MYLYHDLAGELMSYVEGDGHCLSWKSLILDFAGEQC